MPFSIGLVSSFKWESSAICSFLGNFAFCVTLANYFHHIDEELYFMLAIVVICEGVAFYIIEWFHRYTYKMFNDVLLLKRQQQDILKAFPEPVIIVNQTKRELKFRNEEFNS